MKKSNKNNSNDTLESEFVEIPEEASPESNVPWYGDYKWDHKKKKWIKNKIIKDEE
jgi:hypothetical protein